MKVERDGEHLLFISYEVKLTPEMTILGEFREPMKVLPSDSEDERPGTPRGAKRKGKY